MVIKPEEARQKADESDKRHIKYRATSLEEEIDRSVRDSFSRRASRQYSHSSVSISMSEDKLYSKIMETVIADYRDAGWEAEYKQEQYRDCPARTTITLKVGKNTSAKGKSKLLLASIVEKEVVKHEEEQAKEHEKAIDQKLIYECKDKAVWYRITWMMEDEVREMLTQRYTAAGWKVSIKERYDYDTNKAKSKYLVFERE